ncbi:MAG: trypsin-like serine protease [Actinomycetes bacterium]
MRTKVLITLVAVTAMLGLSTPAQAIVNGQADDGEHPYVGELLFYVPDDIDSRFTDPGGWFTCSGTLVDPTTVVTAGHCVYGVGKDGKSTTTKGGDGSGGNDMWISFEAAPDFDILPPSSGYVPDRNGDRYADWDKALDASAEWHSASAYSHPQYDDAAFYLHDLGVLVLDKPVYMSEYGSVAPEGFLTDVVKQKSKLLFEAVGYGLEGSKLNSSFGGDTRMKAQQRLVNLNGVAGTGKGTSAKFSSNKGKNTTGGTCFGDSGGPIFLNNSTTFAAVTSYGISPTCSDGTGGYRIDQKDDLKFLATFGVTP